MASVDRRSRDETRAHQPDSPPSVIPPTASRPADEGATRVGPSISQGSVTAWASEPGVLAILERAAALSPAEMMRIAARLREGVRTPRTIRIAVGRSGRSAAARSLVAEVAGAVERAAGASETRRALVSLGVVFDTGLAAGDAALAALVGDHLSAEVAARLSAPWTSVVGTPRCRS